MPEWGQLPIPKKLLKAGVRDMLRISDARMSGTSYGACILHVAPESFVGGPLAFVQNGDEIEVDVAARRIHLHVGDDELSRRRAAWTAAAAALSARLRRDVFAAYRPGRRRLRLRLSRRPGADRGAGNSHVYPRSFDCAVINPPATCRAALAETDPRKSGLFAKAAENDLVAVFDEAALLAAR